jgi:hypothetical protein
MKKVLIAVILIFHINISFSQDTVKSEKFYAVKGTNIKIIPPKYFITMPSAPNVLIHPSTSSSIQVNEIKGLGYPLSIKKLTPEYIEKQGAKVIYRKDTLTLDGKKGTLFLIRFKVKGKDSNHTEMEYERFMFFTGDYNNTIWISANYPVIAKETVAPVLLHSVLSASFIKQ